MSILETTTFPDIPGIIKQMDIRLKLENISDNSLLGYSIRMALMNKKPNEVIFKTILDAYRDNPEGTLDVIPKPIIDSLRALYHC